jgi:hypothetical protein
MDSLRQKLSIIGGLVKSLFVDSLLLSDGDSTAHLFKVKLNKAIMQSNGTGRKGSDNTYIVKLSLCLSN